MRQEWDPNEESTLILHKIFILEEILFCIFLHSSSSLFLYIFSPISQRIPHILQAEMLFNHLSCILTLGLAILQSKGGNTFRTSTPFTQRS